MMQALKLDEQTDVVDLLRSTDSKEFRAKFGEDVTHFYTERTLNSNFGAAKGGEIFLLLPS